MLERNILWQNLLLRVLLVQVGIVDENNKVDIEVAKGFINSAFDKSGTVEYLGFKFDKSDGEALINIMEKYKDD